MNILFIFGAGASYDLLQNNTGAKEPKFCPPLANNLFGFPDNGNLSKFEKEYNGVCIDILEKNNSLQLQALLGSLRGRSHSIGLEDYLYQKIYIERDKDPLREKQYLQLQRYLRELIRKCSTEYKPESTNYESLFLSMKELVKFKPELDLKISCATFNYDTYLENALKIVWEQKFVSINDYSTRIKENVPVIKLHGSINWAIKMDWYNSAGRSSKFDFLTQNQKLIRSRVKGGAITMHASEEDTARDTIFAPVIEIPVINKHQFSCPDDHLLLLKSCLESADCIVTIGWRGKDENFTTYAEEICKKNERCPILITVGVDGSDETARELRPVFSARKKKVYSNGFSNFVESLENNPNDFVKVITGQFYE